MSTASELIFKVGRPVTIVRTLPGHWVNGMFVSGAEINLQAIASVQPVTGDELLNMPELQRTRDNRKMYITDAVYTAQEGIKADRVILLDNTVWEVQKVEPYSEVMNYCKALIVRVSS